MTSPIPPTVVRGGDSGRMCWNLALYSPRRLSDWRGSLSGALRTARVSVQRQQMWNSRSTIPHPKPSTESDLRGEPADCEEEKRREERERRRRRRRRRSVGWQYLGRRPTFHTSLACQPHSNIQIRLAANRNASAWTVRLARWNGAVRRLCEPDLNSNEARDYRPDSR